MATLATIDALVSFFRGTRAEWNDVNIPVPDGLFFMEFDTTAVKRGNGRDLAADLPELFKLSDLVLIFETLSGKSNVGHHHVMEDIGDLVTLTRDWRELYLEADGQSVVVPWTLTDLNNIDVTMGGVRQYPASLTLVDEHTIRLGTKIRAGAMVLVERWYLKPNVITPVEA